MLGVKSDNIKISIFNPTRLLLPAILALAVQASAQWVAYNDHVAGTVGTTTHVNATTNDMRTAGGPSTLKNITDGSAVPTITWELTNLGGVPANGGSAADPEVGSPLYNMFNTYCYFGANCIQILRTETNTIIFRGLDPTHKYRFSGSSVRQATGNATRWGKFNILGIDSVTAQHQQGANSLYGIITALNEDTGLTGLSGYEVAIHTGANTAGDMVDWTDIKTGSDGQFQVESAEWWSANTIPSHGTTAGTFVPNSGSYGYALDAFRLEDLGAACQNPDTITTVPGPDVTNVMCGTITLSVLVCKDGWTSPFTYQWYSNSLETVIDGATNDTLVLSNLSMGADSVAYMCWVTDATGNNMNVSDPPTTVHVLPDTTTPAIVSALGAVDLTTITVTFDKPVNITGTDAFQVQEADAPANTLPLATAVANGNTVTLTTSSPRKDTDYKVVVQAGNVTDLCNGTSAAGGSFVQVMQQFLFKGFAVKNDWKYNQDGVPFDTFYEVGFDDSAWLSANAAFDGKNSGPRATVGNVTVNTILNLTNTVLPTYMDADIPTYYFRSHFYWPSNADPTASTLTFRGLFDDHVVIYINGVEVYRDATVTAANIGFTNYTGANAVGTAAIVGPTVLGMTTNNVQEGDNVIAVLLKQEAYRSTDITFGLELNGYITNFFTVGGPINITVAPSSVNIGQCGSFNLTATSVSGGYKPYQYKWQKNGSDLPSDSRILGANTVSLTINNAQPGDNGNYTLQVTDNMNSVSNSVAIPVTVAPEPTPFLVSALGLTNMTSIDLVFSQPVNITGPANFSVKDANNATVAVTDAYVTNGNMVVLTTAAREQNNYTVSVVSGVTGGCSGASATGTVPLATMVVLTGLGVNAAWQYNEAGVDLWPQNPLQNVDWLVNTYDDSAANGWLTGDMVFDGKKPQPDGRLTMPDGTPVSTQLMLTNANFPNNTADIPTYYFRQHFTIPTTFGSYGLSLREYADDGIIAFFNGYEAYRSTNVVATNQLFGRYLVLDTIGDAGWTPPNNVPATNVVQGDNVFGVYLKQGTAGSTDITMAVELTALVTNFTGVVTRPRITITVNRAAGTATISWTPAGGRLVQSDNLATAWNLWTDSGIANGGTITLPTTGGLRKFYMVVNP